MDPVLVVTDSSGTAVQAAGDPHSAHHLRVVPISIRFSSTETTDLAVRPEEVFAALAAEEPVKSTAPSPLDYLRAVEGDPPRPAVILTPAAEFTAMYRNACAASELTDLDVRVVDTRTAAAAQALVVDAAVEAARSGATLDRVVQAAEDAAERAELVATLPTMEPLQRTGKVPANALEQASAHGPAHLFRFRDGIVAVVDDHDDDPLDGVLAVWARNGGPAASRSVVFHADRAELARRLRERLGRNATVIDFSPAIALHTGPGTVGLAWLREPAV